MKIIRILFLFLSCSADFASNFQNFVTVVGDKLMDGDKVRFISCNIPNLHCVEDNMQFDETILFRFPDEFEKGEYDY